MQRAHPARRGAPPAAQLPATGACTGISLATTQPGYIHARTIEWGIDLNSKLIISPRGNAIVEPVHGEAGHPLAARGFVGISVSQDNFIGEGMNEAGLNAGFSSHYGRFAGPFDPG